MAVSHKYGLKPSADTIVADLASQINGKVILTTGVSPGGLGATFVEAVSKASPKLLILAGRSPSKVQATALKIKEIAPEVATRVVELDLTSFESVRKAAKEVNAYPENINVVVNNAGIMAVPYSKTKDGNESQFQANHLGHFLFTNLIMDKILASGPGARVVNVSSEGIRLGHVRFFDYHFHDGESYNTWIAYGQSKTAQLHFSQELANRLGSKGLLSFSLHPGVIRTNLGNHLVMEDFGGMLEIDRMLGMEMGWLGSGENLPFVTPIEGAAMHVYTAFAPGLEEHNGSFFRDFSAAPAPKETMYPWTFGDIEAKKVWELSEKLVGEKFDF